MALRQRLKRNGATLYANDVRFELSAWDLRVIFGEMTKYTPPAVVEQHTAVTVSWLQAKVMAIFLCINVDMHERQNGAIRIQKEILGPALQFLGGRDASLEQMLQELIEHKESIMQALAGADGKV